MTTEDIKRLGLILAIQAEIEGMKAHNQWCGITERSDIYGIASFEEKAEEIRGIVYKHGHQL